MRKCLGLVMATFSLLSSVRKPRLPCRVEDKLLLTQLNMMMSFSRPWKASTVFTSIVFGNSQPCCLHKGPSLFFKFRTYDLYGEMTPTYPDMFLRYPDFEELYAMNSISYFVSSDSSKLHFDLSSILSFESFMSKKIILLPNMFSISCKEEESFLRTTES